jgi:hypothetical protein
VKKAIVTVFSMDTDKKGQKTASNGPFFENKKSAVIDSMHKKMTRNYHG